MDSDTTEIIEYFWKQNILIIVGRDNNTSVN